MVELVPASITEDELRQSAAWRRRSLMCQSKNFKPEEEAALLETTAEEVARGFLKGPYSEQETSVLLETEERSLSPRFVLFQGTSGKITVIDDAKKSSVNSSLQFHREVAASGRGLVLFFDVRSGGSRCFWR